MNRRERNIGIRKFSEEEVVIKRCIGRLGVILGFY